MDGFVNLLCENSYKNRTIAKNIYAWMWGEPAVISKWYVWYNKVANHCLSQKRQHHVLEWEIFDLQTLDHSPDCCGLCDSYSQCQLLTWAGLATSAKFLLFCLHFVKDYWFAWRANQWPLVRETLISSVPPSNSLVSVSDPWRAFWDDHAQTLNFSRRVLDSHHALLPELQRELRTLSGAPC